MLLFLIVIFLFHFTELTLLSIERACYQGVKFATYEIENCLRDDQANFNEVRASLTELADTPNAEVLCLAAHTFHERGKVFRNLLRTHQELGNLACVELLTDFFRSLLNRCNSFLVFEIGLSSIFEAERSQDLKLFIFPLIIYSALLGCSQVDFSLLLEV